MASRSRALAPLLRRSVVSSRSSTSALRGGSSPPVPPFARNLAPTEKLVENHDAIWDDGVAPEITIDFDASHISRKEGLLSWLGGLAFFTTLYNLLRLTDPESKNPAVNRKMDVVIGNPKTSFSAGEEEKKEEAAAQDEEEEEDADDDDE